MINEQIFDEDERGYVVFQDESNEARANNCSCIIIEDEPGAYYLFAEELVEKGVCRLAAVLPFSEQSIRLLNGQQVTFDDDITLQISTLTRCVAILDMRNESASTFEGEDDKSMAGAHFQRRLNKQVVSFFATGYGSARFKESGLNGIYGFVDISRKSGTTSAQFSDKDHDTLMSAVELGLNDLCYRTQNSAVVSKKLGVFSFRGWDVPVVMDKPMKALVEVLKAGQDGVHPNKLMKLIGSTSYVADAVSDPNRIVGAEDVGEDGPMRITKAEVKETYTQEELVCYQKLVALHYNWTQNVKVKEQELSAAGIEEVFVKEMCRQVQALRDQDQGRFDWGDFRELLIATFERKPEEWSEADLEMRADLICSYVRLIESEFADVNDEDLKKYQGLLYKWRLLKHPRQLVIYGEPTYMISVRKYIYRALKTIKDSPLAPEEFYGHLRDSIVIDSEAVCYVDGEEWTFK